jgi:hypothetical protein
MATSKNVNPMENAYVTLFGNSYKVIDQQHQQQCYVLQQIQRFEGQTKIEQISVHMDMQKSINKLVSIIMNYIDKVISGSEVYLHDEYKNYTEDRIAPDVVIDTSVTGIDKYIKSYVKKVMREHKELTKDQKINLREFMYLSDPEKDIPEPMDVMCPNNAEMRIGDCSKNNVYEITHDEITLSIMKSFVI